MGRLVRILLIATPSAELRVQDDTCFNIGVTQHVHVVPALLSEGREERSFVISVCASSGN